MDLVIRGGTVITGDGKTTLPDASVWIEGDRIVAVEPGRGTPPREPARRVLDATGRLVIPGVVNGHAHACAAGPLYPSGGALVPVERARRFADRHLLQGTTTLVNVCGFVTMDEHAVVAAGHPMRLKAGTSHLPSCLAAARLVDGAGLTEKHERMTAREMIARGAVALGEIGGGPTLGGGAQDYMYLPKALRDETGVEVSAAAARELKLAVVGRYLRSDAFDREATAAALARTGLAATLSVERAREIVEAIILPPVRHALEGFDEAAALSAETGVPVVFHSSSVSAPHILELARRHAGGRARLVAGHSNHNMFEVDECVEMARALRAAGVVIDVSSLDCVITHWRNTSERIEALAREKLIDTLSTDHADGHWDGILETVHWLVDRGLYALPEAVALATARPARTFDLAAPERGRLEAGAVADVVVTDGKNVGRVETVIIGGRVVADGGRLRADP